LRCFEVKLMPFKRWICSFNHSQNMRCYPLCCSKGEKTKGGQSVTTFNQFFSAYLKNKYSLRPIILFANIDVSRHILVVDTSLFVKSNMGRRE
jgi:hypothetical protein